MLEWWKDLLKPIRRSDADFGEMRFLRQTSTWECRAYFAPVDDLIDVGIEGDAAGPTTSQRELWHGLVERYPRIVGEARELIEKAVDEHEAVDFVFGLAQISLPGTSETEYDLELTFGDRWGPPQYDVQFRQWRLVGMSGPL